MCSSPPLLGVRHAQCLLNGKIGKAIGLKLDDVGSGHKPLTNIAAVNTLSQ